MIARVVLAALLAGIAAGLIMGVVQHVRLTPLILEAERFETATHDHGGTDVQDQNATAHASHAEHQPAEASGSSALRTLQTFLATAVTGAGFAGIAAGFSILAGIPITRQNGFAWGLAGFAVFSLAPAAGLPPELPGVPAADLMARQIWWMATALCTAGALWLLVKRQNYWALPVALVLILTTHIIGAPQPVDHETAVPAALLSRFVASSLAANGLFWLMIGSFLGLAMTVAEQPKES